VLKRVAVHYMAPCWRDGLRPSQDGERRLGPILTLSMTGLISLHTHIALGVSEPHSGCHIFCELYAEGEDRFDRRTHSMQKPHGSTLMYEINVSSALRIKELTMKVAME